MLETALQRAATTSTAKIASIGLGSRLSPFMHLPLGDVGMSAKRGGRDRRCDAKSDRFRGSAPRPEGRPQGRPHGRPRERTQPCRPRAARAPVSTPQRGGRWQLAQGRPSRSRSAVFRPRLGSYGIAHLPILSYEPTGSGTFSNERRRHGAVFRDGERTPAAVRSRVHRLSQDVPGERQKRRPLGLRQAPAGPGMRFAESPPHINREPRAKSGPLNCS